MEDSYKGNDRRKEPRHEFEYLVDYTIRYRRSGTEEFHTSPSGNICFGGVLLRTPDIFTVEEKLDIEVTYTMQKEVRAVFQGVVKWADEKKDTATGETVYSVGVQFNDLTDQQYSVLKEFVEEFLQISIG